MPRLNVTSELRGVSIDRSSPVPLYFQLAQYLEAEIRSGSLPVGTRLENEVALARELGLSRPTVRAAFGYLAERGMVARKRGYGTVVTREKLNRDVQLTSLHDDLIRAGQQPATKVLRNEVAVASESVAAALELPEGSLVICLERIRFADGEPIALMHNFLPAALVRLNDEALETHGLYEILRAAGIALTSATQRMSAKNALAAEARLLDEPRGAALLTMERTVLDDRDRPVEFGQHVYRASRYSLRTSLRMN
ncbi:MAG TPA: GntR family transcriptional regulator [Streptosporangiaceae bacterium]|jgi:DNA-binding GntR family transcriptional regulator|nr:GntR family transcriptional regulator [Streptosporangiaceae bacterium]